MFTHEPLCRYRSSKLHSRPRALRRGPLIGLVAGALLAATAVLVTGVQSPANAATSVYNYAEALQKAVWFYDAQREGKLPADNRVSWRGDSFLSDGKDVGLDLVGGFADAGDQIKATFPLAHSLTTLAWGMIDSGQGYTGSGQDKYLRSNLRWGMDYLIKAHPAAGKLVTEVADPNKDHQIWAAAEVQTYTRETYLMTSGSCWGTDLADSTAAAFASASMVFSDSDPAYATTLLNHAKQLWSTTESTAKTTYHTCTPIISDFYKSWSGYYDELVWGSLWLYRATGDTTYLDRAKAYYPSMPKNGQSASDPIKYSWTYDWDDKTASSFILMAQLAGDTQAIADAKNWADFTAGAGVNGTKVTMSPGGEAFYGTWGSLRYSSGAAWLALVLADSGRLDATRNQQLHDFAVKQINYILGSNPSSTSYLVGFGSKHIMRPHHRTAHGPWSNNFYEPVENRHTLYGALVGGPTAADDNYGAEDRNAYQKAEVALDYNAGLTSALARLVKEYGGTPLASFPPPETKDDELYMTASLNQAGSDFVEIKSLWYNHTAWPARYTPSISFRYYFTLDAGQSAAGITTQVAYEQCANPTGPTQLTGSTYYVTISCAGQNVGPVGQSESRRENQFRITFPGPHDYTKDWSFAGVSTTQSSPTVVNNIPMYDGGTLVWGNPPGEPTPPGAPGKPVASDITSTSATLTWAASTGGSNPIAGYTVYRRAPGGDSPVATTTGATTTTLTNLSPSTPYDFYVTATDSAGTVSAASAYTTVTTLAPPTPPGAPGKPVASDVAPGSVTLTWAAATAGSNPIAGYEVWDNSPQLGRPDAVVASTGADTRTATITGLTPGLTFNFWVKAKDSTGVVGAASPQTEVVMPESVAPGAPGGLQATDVTASSVMLTWVASSAGSYPVAKYQVYEVAPGGDALRATTANATTLSATVSGLEPNFSYTYYVVAVDTAGVASAPSDTVVVVTPPTPTTGCQVNYTITSQWGGGFQGDVKITNTSTIPVTGGWNLTWSFANGQVISQLWNGSHAQSGAAVTVNNLSWNASIGANGGSASFGFIASWNNSTNAKPTAFTLNGATCTVG